MGGGGGGWGSGGSGWREYRGHRKGRGRCIYYEEISRCRRRCSGRGKQWLAKTLASAENNTATSCAAEIERKKYRASQFGKKYKKACRFISKGEEMVSGAEGVGVERSEAVRPAWTAK